MLLRTVASDPLVLSLRTAFLRGEVDPERGIAEFFSDMIEGS